MPNFPACLTFSSIFFFLHDGSYYPQSEIVYLEENGSSMVPELLCYNCDKSIS